MVIGKDRKNIKYELNVRFVKILHLPEFPMLLDLLSSDAYLMFHIKINDDSCDLLFIHTLFPWIQNMTLGTIHKYRTKIGNNVSEFTHSNWMTKSYYSSPKHKSQLQ